MGPSMTLPFISHIFYLNFSNFLLVFQEQSEGDWQSQAAHPTPDVTQKNILKEINQKFFFSGTLQLPCMLGLSVIF